jgi:hypothetical protein
MLFQIIMAVAALVAIYGLRTSQDYYARFILLMMLLSVMLTFIQVPEVKTVGLAVYTVCLVLTTVYALLKAGLGTKKRSLLLTMAIPVFLAMIFQLNHWPYVNILYGITSLSLVAFLVICFSGINNYKNELGIISIIAADALIHVIIYFNWRLYSF